ncbi:SIR2 family protein [uncultured Desulfobacter sp.]|uniref:SIR2 family protein n=1 Tax=uncultured Desulfobacter sp. TaxID=240139 RepID=UPI002AA8E7C0|nr:SIR2 family protein [uncultured Desulfobacter sp.]
MTTEEKDLNIIAKQAQEYYGNSPAVILGSGASASFGLSGMGKLGDHLLSSIDSSVFDKEEDRAWQAFKDELSKKNDLENALQRVQLPPSISKLIVEETWKLLNPEDLKVFYDSLYNRNLFPLGKLLSHMFQSTVKEIDIITTNYDRLAEYACEQEQIHHYTGFSHGYIRTEIAKNVISTNRQVNIWKVHGSLDWFRNDQNILLGLPNTMEIQTSLTPEIVTPGIEKYKRTHTEPFRTILNESDRSIDNAKSYLCIGFGFNDVHIQEKLVNKCVNNSARLLIITHTLTDGAKDLLFVKGCKEYLAFESNGANTKVYSSRLKNPVELIGENYWSLAGLLNLII